MKKPKCWQNMFYIQRIWVVVPSFCWRSMFTQKTAQFVGLGGKRLDSKLNFQQFLEIGLDQVLDCDIMITIDECDFRLVGLLFGIWLGQYEVDSTDGSGPSANLWNGSEAKRPESFCNIRNSFEDQEGKTCSNRNRKTKHHANSL